MRTSLRKRSSSRLVARGSVGQKFQSDGLAEREIVGTIDFAHASLAEQRDDAVAAGDETSGKKSTFTY